MHPHVPAGRYTLKARCFDSAYPHSPYPEETIVLRPGRAPKVHGTLEVTPRTARSRGTVRVRGRGFPSGLSFDPGVFLIPGEIYLTTLRPNGSGEISGTVTLPRLPPGEYRLIAQGVRAESLGELRTLAGPVTIPAPAPRPSTASAKPAPTAAFPTPTRATPTPGPTATPSPTPDESSSPVALEAPDTDGGPSSLAVGSLAGAGAIGLLGATYVVRRRRRGH